MTNLWVGFEKRAAVKAASWKGLGIAALLGLAPAMAHADHPTPELLHTIQQKAKAHGIRPELLEGLVDTESSFRPKKVNLEGRKAPSRQSIGLAQVQPRTAVGLGFKGPYKDLMKPEVNLEYASKYLAKQLKRYHGNERKALSAYNAGHYIASNKDYVQKILKYHR